MARKRLGKDVKCEVCGKEFYVNPSRLKKNKHHTCSRECSGKLNSKLQSKKVKTNCKNCGKALFYKLSHFKQIANHTCSYKCSAAIKKEKYKGQDNPRSLGLNERERMFWDRAKAYKNRSTAKGLESDIDYKFLMELFDKQEGKCYYTGLKMKTEKGKTYDIMSLDRVNSSIGYMKDNVVFCINSINMMKADHDMEDVDKIFEAIYKKKKEEHEGKI